MLVVKRVEEKSKGIAIYILCFDFSTTIPSLTYREGSFCAWEAGSKTWMEKELMPLKAEWELWVEF